VILVLLLLFSTFDSFTVSIQRSHKRRFKIPEMIRSMARWVVHRGDTHTEQWDTALAGLSPFMLTVRGATPTYFIIHLERELAFNSSHIHI
jgi:hypothetical protein